MEDAPALKLAYLQGVFWKILCEALELLMKLPVSSPKRTAFDHLTTRGHANVSTRISSGIHKQLNN